MGFFSELKSAIKLERRFGEVLETFRTTQNLVADLESEVNRLRMQWADHLDLTEKAVGRWAKRESVEKKRVRDAEREAGPTPDLDQLIRDGSVSLGSYRNTGQ